MNNYGIVSSFGLNLGLEQKMPPNWNMYQNMMLEPKNFIKLIRWIPNFLEIGLLLTV